MIGKVPGVIEVKSGIVYAGDALDIRVDRVKVALEGADPDIITRELDNAFSGNVATQIESGPKLIGVRVWLPLSSRKFDSDVEQLRVRAGDHVFPLKRVATVTRVTGQPEIDREDLKRMVAVTARIVGRDLGSTVNDVKQAIDQSNVLPKQVTYEMGGLYEQQQLAFRGLLIVIISAIVLVFLLLLVLYESFRVAIAMLTIPLLALSFVIIGLWASGTELNITSIMGMTMVVGIVTEVSIFYYSEFAELPETITGPERFIAAGTRRARAIAMTTVAAILALMPLALGWGAGAALQQPLAIAIIAGLVVQLPLVLFFLPAILVLLLTGKGTMRSRMTSDPSTGAIHLPTRYRLNFMSGSIALPSKEEFMLSRSLGFLATVLLLSAAALGAERRKSLYSNEEAVQRAR